MVGWSTSGKIVNMCGKKEARVFKVKVTRVLGLQVHLMLGTFLMFLPQASGIRMPVNCAYKRSATGKAP